MEVHVSKDNAWAKSQRLRDKCICNKRALLEAVTCKDRFVRAAHDLDELAKVKNILLAKRLSKSHIKESLFYPNYSKGSL